MNQYEPHSVSENQKADVPALAIITVQNLLETEFPELAELIEGILAPGLYILAGAPKAGKSLLALDMALCISAGRPIWGRQTMQSAVLYLALEDSKQRVQSRLLRMCTNEGMNIGELYIATESEMLGRGLEEQLTDFLSKNTNVKLVIVDTLGKARGLTSSKYNYSEDYAMASSFKSVATRFSVAVLLIHHTRKQEAPDIMNMISGTNGLFGCADGGMVLMRPDRQKAEAVLCVSGKDFPDTTLKLYQDKSTMRWQVYEKDERVQCESIDLIIPAVLELMKETKDWEGTATDLLTELAAIDPRIKTIPNVLIRKLNQEEAFLRHHHLIKFENARDGNEKRKRLSRIINVDDADQQ